MRDFLKWCFDINAPAPRTMALALLIFVALMLLCAGTIAAFYHGWWPVVIFVWVGLPFWFLMTEYRRDHK